MISPKEIPGFPEYLVDVDGQVYTERTGLPRRPSMTREGAIKIALYRHGRPYTKSLARIVAETHVYNDHDPEVFDTPIHLDNDLSNNHSENLAWRPRWFAVKYQTQYWNPEYRYAKVRVEDTQTGEMYDSLMDVCQRYGFLFMDVLNSCIKGVTVFPTWKIFRFID
jgi:hypothetical protein